MSDEHEDHLGPRCSPEEEQRRIEAATAFVEEAMRPKGIAPLLARGDAEMYSVNVHTTIDELCTEHAKRVLAHCNGNRSETCRILWIDRRTIYRWLPKPTEVCATCGHPRLAQHAKPCRPNEDV